MHASQHQAHAMMPCRLLCDMQIHLPVPQPGLGADSAERHRACLLVCSFQLRRQHAGKCWQCTRLPAHSVGVEDGCHTAALQGLQPGGVRSALLALLPRQPSDMWHRAYSLLENGHNLHWLEAAGGSMHVQGRCCRRTYRQNVLC